MCLSRSGRAQHQRLQARVEDERRDGVDELRLEQLDRRTSASSSRQELRVAQVDLLQVLVEPALGEEVAAAPASVLGQQRHLRELARQDGDCRALRASAVPAALEHVGATQALVRRRAAARSARASLGRARLALQHVP